MVGERGGAYFLAQAASPEEFDVCQQVDGKFPIGGSPERLSLQLPGPATPLTQRMMMFVPSDSPAQKVPLGMLAGQTIWLPLLGDVS
jgi:hypothetical protein